MRTISLVSLVCVATFGGLLETQAQEREQKGVYHTAADASIILRCIDQDGQPVSVGFDLERGAWVKPYGQGLHGDMLLKYEYKAGKLPLLYYRGAVLFSFTNRFDGAYVAKKETFSAFMSAYQADTNAIYQQNLAFIYDRISGTIVENSKLADSVRPET